MDHFLLTRFSYRGRGDFSHMDGPSWVSRTDPLEPSRLDWRFKLFQVACLPAVLGQGGADFTWVIIIDKDLPNRHKQELRRLTALVPRVVFHEYQQDSRVDRVDWLTPHRRRCADCLVTTNLDDDDSLPANYLSETQAAIRAQADRGSLPAFKILGSKAILQWDLVTSPRAPWGWMRSWSRGRFFTNNGLTLCCRGNGINLTVLGIEHGTAENIVDLQNAPKRKNVAYIREIVGEDVLREHSKDELISDLGDRTGPVLVVNHAANDQLSRVFEGARHNRTRVPGPGAFGANAIDWNYVRRNRASFFALRPRLIVRRAWLRTPMPLKRGVNKVLGRGR